ncbi:hypothetical protein IU501_35970 [Nocardia otitidiscaviarum]|uniref:DUF6188 family protein n=1 Tax=Nocardia otitidiscaviarum TaxID=1823 RepID=UPI0011DDF79F|nr:DUF6188 family protein [Nocardia otitidiscaviarum]MBF6138372.1 hypothetical protein [Nocardia otitidiscaviarum]MBF6483524.1 hypothetical protein [Nocardia otitidiscaviarum]
MDLQLPIIGQPISAVILEFTATIRIGSPDEFELQIESELNLHTASGDALHAAAGDYSGIGSELESLVGCKVTKANASEVNGLNMEFDSGAAIHVPVDKDYEAWGIVGRSGYRVISTPGGEFAIWSARK